MIKIYKNIIINYIEKSLSIDEIIEFAKKNNIKITTSESIIIYNFIKENYISILNKDNNKIGELKNYIRDDLYQEIISLYNKYKDKL